jgi:hypothetical protein
MPRLLAILVALAALLAPGCGDDDEPPQGAPTARFGEAPVRGVEAVEQIRAQLVPVSDLVGLGRPEEAAVHLRSARADWQEIADRVRRGDAVLEREVTVAFERVDRAIASVGTFDAVRDVAGPLEGQLLGGVREELVPDKDARLDPGVNAAVLVRLLDSLEAQYAAGGRERLLHAYGLVVRSQAVARDIAGELGPQRDAVVEGLKDLREVAYPDGAALPEDPAPVAEVRRRVEGVQRALEARFEL